MARSYTKSYTEIYSYPTIYTNAFPYQPLSTADNYATCVVCRVLYVIFRVLPLW